MSFLSSPRLRRWLLALYGAGVLIATWQRGVLPNDHSTFTIFRQSFVHLATHQNLYASYPAEQGRHPVHRFKYSPTAAMLFAPLSVVPLPLALLVWNTLNVGLLIFAVTRLLPRARANLALLVLAPEVFVAIQASSSNGLVTALIILGAIAFWEGRLRTAALAVTTGAAMKIFPLGTLVFGFMRPRRSATLLAMCVASLMLAALPLLVVHPAELLQQYRWWAVIEQGDAQDLKFGLSLMRQFRDWWEVSWTNWAVQLIGTLVFLTPVALRRDRWDQAAFRVGVLSSLLIFVTLFNHQAERQSFVIAATGCAIWFVCGRITVERCVLLALAIVGVPTVPYLVMWLVIQVELVQGARPAATRSSEERAHVPTVAELPWTLPEGLSRAS
jgi:Protein of unknown function (DUF2029).